MADSSEVNLSGPHDRCCGLPEARRGECIPGRRAAPETSAAPQHGVIRFEDARSLVELNPEKGRCQDPETDPVVRKPHSQLPGTTRTMTDTGYSER